MIEKIETVLKDLLSSFQTTRIYTTTHPKTQSSIAKAFESLLAILKEKAQFTIGLVGDELAYEKEIFFDLSKRMQPMIVVLKAKGIEKITFSSNLQQQELECFIAYLCFEEEEMKCGIQEYLSLKGVRNITAGKITFGGATGQSVEIPKSVTALEIYENSLDRVAESFDNLLDNNKLEALELRFTMLGVMENLLGKYQEFLKLTAIKKYDKATFTHLLNVAILTMNFSLRLGFSKDESLEFGVAALFHDIGKIYVSRKILQKEAGLSQQEYEAIKSHTVLGASILLRYINTLGILPVVVAFEHHQRYDDLGYPHLGYSCKPSIASSIVSVCDSYDALLQRRTYKRDYPPRMIYDIMVRERGEKFEPAFIDKFFRFMGAWPSGTIVVLSDNRLAIVREQNDVDIFLPKVELIEEGSSLQFLDLKASGITIARSLNPLGDGKSYLHLI